MIKMPFLIGKPQKSLRTSDTVVSNENFFDDSFASIFGDKFFWGCNSTINFIRTIVQTRSGLVLIKVGQRHGRSEKEIQIKKNLLSQNIIDEILTQFVYEGLER